MLQRAVEKTSKKERVNFLNRRRRDLHNLQRTLLSLRVRIIIRKEHFAATIPKVFIPKKIA
jgi:hypothetical protein